MSTAARSQLVGALKLEIDHAQLTGRRFDISLKNGVYTCRSSMQSLSVPADGNFHAVTGHGHFEQISVRVMTDRSIIFTRRKGERGIYQAVEFISEDGGSLAFSWTELSEAGKFASGTGRWIRVGSGPQGDHPITGTWSELQPDGMAEQGAVSLTATCL